MRRGAVLLCLALLSPAACAPRGGERASAGGARPNLVVYLVDTLRADHLGAIQLQAQRLVERLRVEPCLEFLESRRHDR